MILILGLRYDVGIDYPVYEEIYNNPASVHALFVEPIWHIFNDILRSMGLNSRAFFFITSFIITFFYYKGIEKMSDNFYLSLILYILCSIYFESANLVRQFTAMSIIFASFHLFLEKKYLKFILAYIIACCCHLSAIIFFPILIICNFKYSIKLLYFILIFTFLFGNKIMNFIINNVIPLVVSNLNKYDYEVDDFDSGVNSGLLKFVYLVLGIIIIYLYSRKKDYHIFTNLVIVGLCIYNVFYIFMPARRLYLYCFPFFIILYPKLITNFTFSSRIIVTIIIFLLFGLFLVKSNIDVPYNWDLKFI